MIIRIIIAISLLFFSTPINATKSENFEKLEQCLHEFYQGRPRDYPLKAEKKEIVVFKSENGSEYIHKKELRGMKQFVIIYMLQKNKNVIGFD